MRMARGFSLIEVLISAVLISLAAMAGVAYISRGSQQADWSRDKVWARQKALSIIAELKAYVDSGQGELASDLDGFDDGVTVVPALTIARDPDDPESFVAPDHALSGNVQDQGVWRWGRQISVRRVPGTSTRDLRMVTVRVFRMRAGDAFPGERMAEVASLVRSIADAYPSTQVYDLYLLALENVPGWWVYMEAMQAFVEGSIQDLESRNPGLKFRTHWITRSGFGRDEEYAPYTNLVRDSREDIPWTHVYPGTMPEGEASDRYYVPERMGARLNRDGVAAPAFVNDFGPDNPWPYALADGHNHAMRAPQEAARFAARVAAGLDRDDAPTLRLLLDRMIAEPERYHSAILVNLHGELLPMPAVRNVSDAAKAPDRFPGWRVVAHPERLHARRVAGSDALSRAPVLRVHAWKAAFPSGHVPLMTQEEPFTDQDGDGEHDAGEPFEDWNGNGARDAGVPISVVIPGGDFAANPNGAPAPTLLVERLPGGIDADADGSADPYQAFHAAPRYPEPFGDLNGDGIRQVAEPFLDLNGNGVREPFEPFTDGDGDGAFTPTSESLADGNGNGRFDPARPAERYTDLNGNGRWDAAEPYWDRNGNGQRDGPTILPAAPFVPWDPADHGDPAREQAYVDRYGEPFVDQDADGVYDPAEPFTDDNRNGVCDGGFERGEMWYTVAYDAAAGRTVLLLYGTPLEAPYVSGRGLNSTWRLYDLEHVPCPTPASASSPNPFERDLAAGGDVPKNTARWRVTLPPAAIRAALASAPGAGDGDATDRVLAFETRIGADLATGTLWPVRRDPPNRSETFVWFTDDPEDVPFSERYQFQGDPRHCPYADLARNGESFPHGYNWYFDDLVDGGTDRRGAWLAFDGARLKDRWRGRIENDVPRFFEWLRTALVRCEAHWTTLTGFSYYYLSLGGDVGYDSANGYPNSIPMDGKPFGLSGDVYENTIIPGVGTSSIRGSRKLVHSNGPALMPRVPGAPWWSKPWIGELYEDGAYASQWAVAGNLRANTGAASGEYRLVRRSQVPTAQQPSGTRLSDAFSRTQEEGCTSLFNIGTASSTFHHQYQDGRTGQLVDDGPQLAQRYNLQIPDVMPISRPFSLTANGSGGVGDEFAWPDVFPRHTGQLLRRFYDHQSGALGSALVLLKEPGLDARAAHVVVNGLDRTTEAGTSLLARYSLVSLLHGYFASGVPGTPNRPRQLPRVALTFPTWVSEITSPASIRIEWSAEWKRWDGQSYTAAYPEGFAEDEADLVYVLYYSRDNGKTWANLLTDEPAEPGVLPWVEGVGPDPARTRADQTPAGDEAWVWETPASRFPEGTYLLRVDAFRRSEALHYSQHMEKIYVNR